MADDRLTAEQAAGEDGDGSAGGSGSSGADTRAPLFWGWTAVLGFGFLALGFALAGTLLTVWPLIETAGGAPVGARAWEPLGLFSWSITPDTALMLLVVVASMLGGYVHAATSFATYAGNRKLYASWVWWYVLRLSIGAALALIVYFVLRGGLTAGSATTEALNPYGVAAIAALTGLFSKQATDKLREVFDTVLSTRVDDGDAQRADKVDNPRPSISRITPSPVPTGGADRPVTLAGEGLLPETLVHVRPHPSNDPERSLLARAPADGQLEVVIPRELLATVAVLEVVAENPKPGGGRSEPALLPVVPDQSGQPQEEATGSRML